MSDTSAFPAAADDEATLPVARAGWQSLLTAPITATDTTLPVTDTTGAPVPGVALLGPEVVGYTGVTPTSLTGCTRGLLGPDGGAPPQPHGAGAVVRQATTANSRALRAAVARAQNDAIRKIEAEVLALMAGGGGGGAVATVSDTSTIEMILASGDLSAEVLPGGIDHQDLAGAGTNDHATIDAHLGSTSNPHGVTAAQVGLGAVDNTSDADKPVSTAQAAAIAVVQSDVDTHEARTDNPHAVTKAQVGLSNVDNTSDANKPVSTAQATANTADRARANHTGTQAAATISDFATAADARISAAAGVSIATLSGGKIPSAQIPAVALATVQTAASQVAMLALTTQEGDVVVRTDEHKTYMRNAGTSGTMADFTLLDTPTDAVTSVAGKTGTVTLAKGDVGLGNVDNTSDASKPVSTAQQAALNLKANLASPTFTGTVGGITKAMVGLGNVDNTADTAKPISTATQTALDGKQPLDADLTALASAPGDGVRTVAYNGDSVTATNSGTTYATYLTTSAVLPAGTWEVLTMCFGVFGSSTVNAWFDMRVSAPIAGSGTIDGIGQVWAHVSVSAQSKGNVVSNGSTATTFTSQFRWNNTGVSGSITAFAGMLVAICRRVA